MILSASRLRKSVTNGGPEVCVTRERESDAYRPIANCITNVGFDVTLGVEDGKAYDLTTQKFLHYSQSLNGQKYLTIEPGHAISVQTCETLKLGPKTAALVESKVRMVSRGVSHISTTIDPEWNGKLLLTFAYFGKQPLRLFAGDAIATVVFLETTDEEHSPGDANPRNNADRWNEYAVEQASATSARTKTWVVAGVSSFVLATILVGPALFLVIKEARDEHTAIGKAVLGVIGETMRQQIEFSTWLVALLTFMSMILTWLIRRVFVSLRRRLSGTIEIAKPK